MAGFGGNPEEVKPPPGRLARCGWAICHALTVTVMLVGCNMPPRPRVDADALERLRRSVRLDDMDLTVSYLSAGDVAGTLVVMIHGTPGSASGWGEYLMDPPVHTQVTAIDRPGFGNTQPLVARTSLADQASAVAALIPEGRQAVLVGHSLGGPIAAWVAAAMPDKVKAIILVAASLDPGLERIHPLQPLGEWWPFRVLLPTKLYNANRELMALKPQLELLSDMLGRIRCPVIIIHGTKDDLVPFPNVAFMQEKITNARVETIVLEGANHFLIWNSSGVVRQAIDQALALSGSLG